MDFIRKRIKELEQYHAALTTPEDMEDFWERTLQDAARKPLRAERERTGSLSPHMEVYKVTYEGYDETRIHGLYLLPAFIKGERLPCIVVYHGYHGGKGSPEDYAGWLLMGYAVLAIDIRGQGGETGNGLAQSFGMTKGWITQGLLDPEHSYYQAITVDALKALDWIREQPEIDAIRIAVAGESQGGGLALIVSALSGIPSRTIAGIPNMCHMDYGIFHSTGSLTEAAEFVSRYPEYLDRVLRTLSYFDILNLCGKFRNPVMITVGLKDTICIPETVYAVYNRLTVRKEIHVYPFNGHQSGADNFSKRAAFLKPE